MPPITLLTDFGLRDHFVGAMKGVILSLAPRATIVDITHGVDAFQIAQARFLLQQSWPCFPKKTVHVAVVDPGVGSDRRPILVEAAGHLFIGPDNGIFSALIRLEGARVRLIANAKLFRQPVSTTFHGRDIFAPVAAHLARGLAPSKVGPRLQDALFDTLDQPIRTGKRTWSGTVLHIDGFGNLITNFRCEEFASRRFILRLGPAEIILRAPHYSAVPVGEVAILEASHGNLELSAAQTSAAALLKVAAGAPVELETF
jgi:S-adenosyl-L-methionine hydrolase (adenosine-forming)